MKFTVMMKDPDSLDIAIDDAGFDDVKAMGLPEDEAEALIDVRKQKAKQVASKWFKYGEYLEVEIDTEAGTCTVLPAK